MAHQHHGARALGQKLLQPLYRLDVEMVGRLVEQQHVGFLQQYLGQLYTHAPTARKLAGGALKVGALKSQSGQRALYLGLVVLGAHHHVALVLGGVLLYQLQVALALVVGALGQLLVHLVQSLLHAGVVGKCLLCLLAHGGVVLQYHHLWQVAYLGVAGHADVACSGFLQSAQYLEHGALAGSVLTHQRYAVAVVNHKAGIVEQRLDAEFYFQSFYRYHRLSTYL